MAGVRAQTDLLGQRRKGRVQPGGYDSGPGMRC